MSHFYSFCSDYGILGCVVNPWSRRGTAKLCRGKSNFAVEKLNFAVVTQPPKIYQNYAQYEPIPKLSIRRSFYQSKFLVDSEQIVMNDIWHEPK